LVPFHLQTLCAPVCGESADTRVGGEYGEGISADEPWCSLFALPGGGGAPALLR
jgi:hypothetical protein